MDSSDFVLMQRMAYSKRIASHYQTEEQRQRKKSLHSRLGIAPVDTCQKYQMFSDGGAHRHLLMFGSNNYLGLSNDDYVKQKVMEAVKQCGIGSGGSPVFSGYTTAHRNLELRLAKLAGHEDAILLPSGFMANLCWVTGLMNRDDIILYDKHSHASVLKAIKMAGVKFYGFNPEDMDSYEQLVRRASTELKPGGQLFSTIEGVRSIDGTVAPLHDYIRISKKYNLVTILDDAHGLGVMGKTGYGTLEHWDLMGEVDYRMSTCSKALGAQGAFISGPKEGIFYLRSFSDPYVFTSAMAQPLIAAIDAGIDILQQEPQRRQRLHDNVAYMQEQLIKSGFKIIKQPSAIIPVFIPDGIAAPFNQELHQRGLFANIMEYPMVPPGMERLRLSIMSNHTQQQMDEAIKLLVDLAEKFGVFNTKTQEYSNCTN